jgi:GNAT superfamily N-acetyltransferase
MEIRRAREGDVGTVRRIHGDAIRDVCAKDYPPDVIAAWLDGRSDERYLRQIREDSVWVAIEQTCVAFGSVRIDTAKLESLFVDPPALGHGHAAMLLAHLESVALRAEVAVLNVDSSLTARGFYARHGYEVREGDASLILASGVKVAGVPMSKRLRA